MKENTASTSGMITDMTVPWLFQELYLKKKTGTVIFANNSAVKKVYFSRGDCIYASSNLREDWLGERLLQMKTITTQQFDESSAVAKMSGKKQGGVLVELGFLSAKGLVDGVKLQVKQIILSLFTWREGYYIFDEGPLPGYDIITLQMSVGNLIAEGLRNAVWDRESGALPRLNTVIRPIADPALLFQDADLDQDQRKVFSLIDGKKSIEELCCVSGIGDPATLKAVYVLLALRMAETGELKDYDDREFVCAMASETALPEDRKTAASDFTRTLTRETLQNAYDGLSIQNYYEILGVSHTASQQEIKKAFFSLSKYYHPDQHFQPELSEMKTKLEALNRVIKEAYETLIDAGKRSQYNLDLASGEKKDFDVEGIHAAAQWGGAESPDGRFSEGLKQFRAGDYWSAEESFQRAVSLDPGNAKYVFHRGLALSHLPRKGREAEELLVRAVEMAPSNIEYSLELGNFYEKFGLKAKALSHYKQALKRNQTSEKIMDAVKKLDG